MQRRSLLGLLLASLLLVLPAPGRLAAEEGAEGPKVPEVFPLSAVRPGMKGTGYTVKAGTRIEPFEVVVLDVMRNFLNKQDVILVRCLGEAFASHRVAQGMSGSPIYIDGKIVGALSYTWGWEIEALGGITPIESMLAEGQRPLDDRPAGAEPPTELRTGPPGPMPEGEFTRPRPSAVEEAGQEMVPIGTPVCVSGFSSAGRRALAESMAPYGLDVRAAGGGAAGGKPARWADLDAPMVPGAALVVELMRGDYDVSVLGTCTHVDGDKVYGFGHSFNGVGQTLYPMSVGYVYTVVASRNISFKMGSGLREVGAVIQDRQSCIVGVLGQKAPMVPFDVRMRNVATGHEERFHFEVCENTLFFQQLLLIGLRECFAKGESVLGGNTKRYRMELKLKGVEEPWVYEDVIAGFDGGMSRLLIGLVDRVMIHPTQRASFESFRVDVDIDHVDRRADLVAVTAARDEVRPGEEVELTLRFRVREGGALAETSLPVRVPDDAPAGNLVIQVTGGDNVPAAVAAPVDVLDIPRLYDGFYKSTEVVAVVPTGRVDLDIDGRLVRGIPLSALPRLARSPEAASASLQPVTVKVRKDVPYVVAGAVPVTLTVVR
jgi:hypothetical protein